MGVTMATYVNGKIENVKGYHSLEKLLNCPFGIWYIS